MVPSVMLGLSWMTSGVSSGSFILAPNDSGISTATELINYCKLCTSLLHTSWYNVLWSEYCNRVTKHEVIFSCRLMDKILEDWNSQPLTCTVSCEYKIDTEFESYSLFSIHDSTHRGSANVLPHGLVDLVEPHKCIWQRKVCLCASECSISQGTHTVIVMDCYLHSIIT